MGRRFWILAALLVTASPASGRDLHVSARIGPDAGDPACTAANPCTLGTAMGAARPGDRVLLAAGNYSRFGAPVPRADGSPGRAIEVRGDPARPNAVVLRGFEISRKAHVTWRSLRCGDLEIGRGGRSGHHLRFDGVRVIGSLWVMNLSHSTFERCRVYPRQVQGGFESTRFRFGTDGSTANVSLRNVMNACSVTVVANSRDHQTITDWKIQFDSEKANSGRGIESCVFSRNVFRVVFQRDATENARAVYWARLQNCRFQDNRWWFQDSTTGGCPGDAADQRMRIRNWVRGNLFLREIYDLRGNCGALMLSSQSEGTERWQQGRNRWDGCFFNFQSANVSSYGPVRFDWGVNGDTLQNCVFVSRSGPCLLIRQIHANDPSGPRPMTSVLRHNTFYAAGAAPAAVIVEPAEGRFGSWDATASLSLTRNIFHLARGASSRAAALYVEAWRDRRLTLDQNLYFFPGGGSGRAVRFKSGCTGGRDEGCSDARFSSVGPGSPWHRATRADGSSRWGDPLYADPRGPSFVPTPRRGSAALFGPGGYVGARRPQR